MTLQVGRYREHLQFAFCGLGFRVYGFRHREGPLRYNGGEEYRNPYWRQVPKVIVTRLKNMIMHLPVSYNSLGPPVNGGSASRVRCLGGLGDDICCGPIVCRASLHKAT